MTNSKKGKEENKWLREREKMGVRFCPSLSLSLSMGSTSIFRLLQVCLKSLSGEQGIIVEDPKKPWAGEETNIEEIPFRELTKVWDLEVSTLVLTLVFGIGGWLTSLLKDLPLVATEATSLNSLGVGSRLEAIEVFLFIMSWPTSGSSVPFSVSGFPLAPFLPFFSFPLPRGVVDPMSWTAHFLVGTPKEEPITNSLPCQEGGKSLAWDTQPFLDWCHSIKPIIILIAADIMPGVGRARHLLSEGMKEILGSGTSLTFREST